MFLKLMCLFYVILAAQGASLSAQCPRVKNPVEPDLEKLSGLWHTRIGDLDPYIGCTVRDGNRMEIKKEGVNYTATLPNSYRNHNRRITTTKFQFAVGFDEENMKILKRTFMNEAFDDNEDFYLAAAEYDKFVILYNCKLEQDWSTMKLVKDQVHRQIIVLSRSEDMDEYTRIKIVNVFLNNPQLYDQGSSTTTYSHCNEPIID